MAKDKRDRSNYLYAPRNALEGVYPEHDKVAPHVAANWDIRDFLEFMRGKGAQMFRRAKTSSGAWYEESLSADALNDALLEFRGADPKAYAAESKALMGKYGPALGILAEELVVSRKPLSEELDRANLMKIITTLDKLGVPAWAGRPTCRSALMAAGMTQPETGVFARAVKLRKSIYGITDPYANLGGRHKDEQPELPLEPAVPQEVAKVEKSTISEKDAVAALLGKMRGEGNAAQN